VRTLWELENALLNSCPLNEEAPSIWKREPAGSYSDVASNTGLGRTTDFFMTSHVSEVVVSVIPAPVEPLMMVATRD
jgi:hypothetical protein